MGDDRTARYADVALPVPLLKTFTYEVPEEFLATIRPGMRVLVPFGPRSQTGVVVALKETTNVRGLKRVRDLLDVVPSYNEEMLRLTRWIADYYFTPWGEVLRAAAPQGFAIESFRLLRLSESAQSEPNAQLGRMQRTVLEILSRTPVVSFNALKKRAGTAALGSVIASLETRGMVSVEDSLKRPKASVRTIPVVRLSEGGPAKDARLTRRSAEILEKIGPLLGREREWKPIVRLAEEAGASSASIMTLSKKGALELGTQEMIRDPFAGPVVPPPTFSLTPHQRSAVDAVSAAVTRSAFATFLLYGITGSGKTQVYIEALKVARREGKSAIVLVPEISLTPQTVRRFRSHFPDDVVVMHSQLSAGERFDAWRRVHSGVASIVIGPRSAVFAPLNTIGLIVVDEEHESSYKQYEGSPRYNARDVAVVRGRENNAVVMLGSATPSVESMWNAASGKYTLLELPERVDDAKLPVVKLVDMVAERKRHFERIRERVKSTGTPFPKKLPPHSLSEELVSEILKRIGRKEGVILLHNRRGFAHVLSCDECGYVEACRNCDVTMTYHLKTKDLRCHYCGSRRGLAAVCPACMKGILSQTSYGTQQVFDELTAACPGARIIRMDKDTTRRKGTFDSYLNAFEAGEADILLGTQMVAKGLDFPRVTLVGVISAETQLYLPDFRAAERTFQLLTQVAGRAGRGRMVGEVLIQSVNPQHRTLLHATTHDYRSFYAEELEVRNEALYPPKTRLVLVECSGKNESAVAKVAARIAGMLKERNVLNTSTILGPAEPAIAKLKNSYRQHILVKNDRQKDPGAKELRHLVDPLVSGESLLRSVKGVRITVDVDPQTFL